MENKENKLCSPLIFIERIPNLNKFEKHELGESIGWFICIAGPFIGLFVVGLLSFFE